MRTATKESSMKKILFALFALCLGIGLTSAPQSAGAAYPDKPIRIIVARNAGGSADIVARMYAPFLQKYIGANVVVENITGGAGKIGLSQAFRAAPDGYTLVLGNFPSYILTQHIEGGVDYVMSEFEPIVQIAGGDANVLIVPGNSPFNSVDDVVKYAKEHVGELNLGITSGLSNSSMALGMLLGVTGIEVQPIPFDDGTSTVTAAMGGHIDLGICSAVASYQPASDGALKVLTTFGVEADKNLPTTPLFSALYGPEYGYDVTMGLLAPPKVPADVLKTLRDAAYKAATDPEFAEVGGKAFGVMPMDWQGLAAGIANNYKLADDSREIQLKLIGE
jgi:tripartite-type tricarboxylate transporter receptor subunit TctC